MRTTPLFFAFFSALVLGGPSPQGDKNLVLIGGGDLHPPALKKIGALAGGKSGTLLVIPWASSTEQKEAFTEFQASMQNANGAKCPTMISAEIMPDRVDAYDLLKDLDSATGVFFTGGDQNRLMEKLAQNPKWIPALQAKYRAGFVFGGTSAGTAIMTATMMTGKGDETTIDPDKVVTAKGLGLLPGALVDQHFLRRQRQNRLFSILLRGRECFAFGIDEENAVYVTNNSYAEVLGPGTVMTIDHCSGRNAFAVELKTPGESFEIRY